MRADPALAAFLILWFCGPAGVPLTRAAHVPRLAQGADWAGVYTIDVEGESLRLELRPDGSADFEDDTWRWRPHRNGFQLLGPDGEIMQGRSEGANLVLVDEVGERLPLRRVGKTDRRGQTSSQTAPKGGSPVPHATRPSPPPPPTGKAPRATLKGQRVTPRGQSASLVVPTGWKHQWGNAPSGEAAYVLTPARGPSQGIIALSMMPLSGADASRSVSELLRAGLEGLLAGQPYTLVEGPHEFAIDDKPAGRVIVSATIAQADGSMAPVEGQLGGLIAEDFAYVLLSLYPSSEARLMREGADTALATLRVSRAQENGALKSRILGCWNHYDGRTDRDSSHSESRTYQFAADGSYAYRGRLNVNAAGMSGNSGSEEHGRFRVLGSMLHLFPAEGAAYSAAIRLEGGKLIAGGQAYLPCR